MISFNPSQCKGASVDTRKLFLETFGRQIQLLEQGKAKLRIPRCRTLFDRRPGMAFHFKPEFFIQLGGATEFSMPEESFSLGEGEICVMPRGIPHGERTRDGSRPFENVVVCFYNDTVAIHVAHEDRAGKPIVDDIFFFTTHLFEALVSYLNQIGDLHAHAGRGSETAIKGLMLAELALLRGIVEGQDAGMYSETERVFRCQWLIRNNLDDADMGVESLAAELRCSAAHLSKLFHQETGQRITEYITNIRLGNAVEAMHHSDMSVKEIATACGFNDPNYFTKVFRKATGRTPVQFRTDLRAIACRLDKDPKVVYYDHEERDFGLRPQVMEKAQARLNR